MYSSQGTSRDFDPRRSSSRTSSYSVPRNSASGGSTEPFVQRRSQLGESVYDDSVTSSASESFLDSDLEMRRYQGLPVSGVPGYQTVRMGDVSEPDSPLLGEPDERSTGSGSSGTKHEQLGFRSRDTMSSDGSFDPRGARNVRPSHSL